MPSVVSAVIRLAEADDLEGVLAVGHRTWPPTYEPIAGADYVAMALAKWWSAESTRPAIEAGRMTVAEVDGEVVGVAAAGPHRADGEAGEEERLVLWKLYVVPEYQRRGIGARLLRAVLDAARAQYADIRLAYLDGNNAAQGFYSRHGFVEMGREPGSGGLPDTVWMSRPVEET